MRFTPRPARIILAGIVLLFGAAAWGAPRQRSGAITAGGESIEPNDNRAPGGSLRNGILVVEIEAREGTWHPEGATGAGLDVYAFAETGKALTNPGPLIRVRTGAEAVITITNRLEKTLRMHGLGDQRGVFAAPVEVKPGASHEFRFRAGAPGVYYYAGRTDSLPPGAPVFVSMGDDSQLNGAIVIDPADAPAPATDRILMISWWIKADPTSPTGLDHATMAINGLSWPHTERFEVTVGDSLRWRWVNTTALDHPMHLHGFYFRVEGRGDGATYRTFANADRRLAVTEVISPGGTLDVLWAPTRPGNWLFHCHSALHVSPLVALSTRKGLPGAAPGAPSADASHRMAGLVLGIIAKPNTGAGLPASQDGRPIRLLVRSKPRTSGPGRQFAYVLGDSPEANDREAYPVPGPTLELEQGKPVAVTIVNQSEEPAGVHWHGIEVESFSDGVPGWSGTPGNILGAIQPGDSLTVHFTPPRVGTFMYHSHYNELNQIMNGLFGAIVVVPPGRSRDAELDRVLMLSDGVPWQNVFAAAPPLAVNGHMRPDAMAWRAGQTYRLRLVNILTDATARVKLMSGDSAAIWRVVAKDGADLPAHQVKEGLASLVFGAGEIYDVEVTPSAGTMRLVAGIGSRPTTDVSITVR